MIDKDLVDIQELMDRVAALPATGTKKEKLAELSRSIRRLAEKIDASNSIEIYDDGGGDCFCYE